MNRFTDSGAHLTALALAALAIGSVARADTSLVAALSQRLESGDASTMSGYGRSVAVHGDRMVIGSPAERRAYVYERGPAGWVESAVLVSGSPPQDEAYFGIAVALEGDVIAVAGTTWGGSDSPVCLWVFELVGATWTNPAQRELDDSDGSIGTMSVALSGDRIVVGAPLDADLQDRGRVALFERGDGSWPLICTFLAPASDLNDNLGWSVALDGATVLAGAPNAFEVYVLDAAAGCALVQVLDPGGPVATFGWSVALDADRAAVGARLDSSFGLQAGSVHTFERTGGSWNAVAQVIPAELADGDWFGYSVDLEGDILLSGAVRTEVDFAEEGAAYLFAWDGTGWCQEARLRADNAAPQTRFGHSVALELGTLAVGSLWGNGALLGSGVAHAFEYGHEQGTSYCIAGINSTGQPALIRAFGSARVADDDLHLFVQGAPADESGLFLFGPNAAQVPFGNGFRCVASPVFRVHPILATDAAGGAWLALDLDSEPALSQIANAAPVTMNFQFWFRDGSGWNLSDGVSVDFQ